MFAERQKFMANSRKPPYNGIFDPTHAFPNEIAEIIPNAADHLSFAVVRNPWDRIVSMYTFVQRKRLWISCGFPVEPSFEEFCELAKRGQEDGPRCFYPSIKQSEWLKSPFKITEILRFENLLGDFNDFLIKYGLDHISPNLPKLNDSRRIGDYRQFYSEKTRQIVEDVYNDDIKAFNYTFDP